MIFNYKIKKLNSDEEALILYLDIDEEFSLEWFKNIKDKTIDEFIKYNNIIWNGTKIFLVVGGVTLAVLNYNGGSSDSVKVSNSIIDSSVATEVVIDDLSEENSNDVVFENSVINKDEVVNSKEPIKIEGNRSVVNNNSSTEVKNEEVVDNSNTSNVNQSNDSEPVDSIIDNDIDDEVDNTIYVTVYRSNGRVESVAMDDYLIGVVAAEMPASFKLESLKVQSILARTYVMKAIDRGVKVTDTVSTQRYIDVIEMKKMWGADFDKYYSKIKDAVNSTSNLVVTYNGALIECVYHSTSNGMTEDSINVWGNSYPYLVSVDSHWDRDQTSYFRSVTISIEEFLNKLGCSDASSIEILERNASGRVMYVKVGDVTYSGVDFRNKLGLRSTDFDISIGDNSVVINTRGYGHGVGLSQYGANGMAKEGYSYVDIIKHYYRGVSITDWY